MPARHYPLGEPAHEAERQAIRLIVDGLPDDYIVYSNAWLVERSRGRVPARPVLQGLEPAPGSYVHVRYHD